MLRNKDKDYKYAADTNAVTQAARRASIATSCKNQQQEKKEEITNQSYSDSEDAVTAAKNYISESLNTKSLIRAVAYSHLENNAPEPLPQQDIDINEIYNTLQSQQDIFDFNS